jgi:hypothetical protein
MQINFDKNKSYLHRPSGIDILVNDGNNFEGGSKDSSEYSVEDSQEWRQEKREINRERGVNDQIKPQKYTNQFQIPVEQVVSGGNGTSITGTLAHGFTSQRKQISNRNEVINKRTMNQRNTMPIKNNVDVNNVSLD